MSKEQKKTLFFLRFFTVLSAIIYPFSFMIVFSFFSFHGEQESLTTILYLYWISFFILTIVTLLCLWKMWEYYIKEKYRRARWYGVFPVILLAAVISFLTISYRMTVQGSCSQISPINKKI
jgi:hypothetical protein